MKIYICVHASATHVQESLQNTLESAGLAVSKAVGGCQHDEDDEHLENDSITEASVSVVLIQHDKTPECKAGEKNHN